MPALRPSRPTTLLRAAMAVPVAAALLTTSLAGTASAHGSTVEPPSRNFGCWERWGDDFQNPRMATEDPMCWQAWQADPNAMWNWNGTYRDGVGGNHRAAVPDGQLCSAGRTGGDRYAALDEPGAWRAEQVGNNFTVTVHDQARHGGDYYRIYVTKQGFDPTTERLGWGDLELVEETGRIAPGAGRDAAGRTQGGTLVDIPVSVSGRTGRHIVYTVWQASHSDQSYYLCSDVIFGGGGSTPAPRPTTTTTAAPRPTTTTTTVASTPTTATPTPTTVAPTPTTQRPPTTVAPNPGGDDRANRWAAILRWLRARFGG